MSAMDNAADAIFRDLPDAEGSGKPRPPKRRRFFGRGRPAPKYRPVRRRRRTPGTVLWAVVKYGSLLMMTLAVLLPLLGTFMTAFKTHKEYFNSQPMDPPGNWLNFDNFFTAFNQGHMLEGFVNTTIILVISVTGTIIIGTMTAYAIDRFRFRGRKTVLFLFLLAAIVPSVTQNVGTFQVINFFNLFNTRISAIALFIGTDIISIYIFMQFMRTIPIALDEYALLEGASHWYIYRHIAFPLMRPAIVTVIIIKGVAIYNDFFIPFLYMPASDLKTVSMSLFTFNGTYGARWEVIAAGVIITLIPTLIVFLALQRYIYNGLIRGTSR
jgi:raffinose/stachyose/melibiose transport system permease protein